MNSKKNHEKQSAGYTINDIAAHTGLSRSTVSRVINDAENVSDGSRRTVQNAIEELGYVPNMIARGLRTTSKMIGVLIQDILNPYSIEAIYAIEKACKARGYTPIHMNSDSSPDLESENLYHLLGMKVQGVILLANMLEDNDRMIQLAQKETKLISVEGKIQGVTSVLSDPHDGIEEMVDRLCALGHKTFGLVHHSMRSFPILEREQVFLSFLSKKGYSVSDTHFFYGNDYLAQLDEALSQKNLPTAIFALNDNTAFNIYGWCKENKISIPRDLSVVGFDDVRAYSMMMPTLTTIHQPIGTIALSAVNALIDSIEKTGVPPEIIRVGTRFVERESIAPPRK